MEKKLYELIWKRTVASQMADAKVEKTTITIDIENADGSLLDTAENITFIATGEVIRFDGFMKAYHESTDEDTDKENGMNHLPTVRDGEMLKATYRVRRDSHRVRQDTPRHRSCIRWKSLE